MVIDLNLAMAVICCAIGIFGWLSGREKSVGDEAEWRGNVNAKLDLILTLQKDIGEVTELVNEHEKRITIVENSASAFHRRMDDLTKVEIKK